MNMAKPQFFTRGMGNRFNSLRKIEFKEEGIGKKRRKQKDIRKKWMKRRGSGKG